MDPIKMKMVSGLTEKNRAPALMTIRSKEKSAATAFFLCLFLGHLGGHRFYLNQKGLGFLYMFTLGFLFIGTFIDLFLVWGYVRKCNDEIATEVVSEFHAISEAS